MGALDFPNGLTLFRSTFEIDRTCVIDTVGKFNIPTIGTTMLVSGTAIMETPDGEQHPLRPNLAIFSRINEPGTRFILPGNQRLLHVGVSTSVDALLARVRQDDLPPPLLPLRQTRTTPATVHTIPIGNRLHRLKALLHTSYGEGFARTIALEGIASQVLAELLVTCARQESTSPAARTSAPKVKDVACWLSFGSWLRPVRTGRSATVSGDAPDVTWHTTAANPA